MSENTGIARNIKLSVSRETGFYQKFIVRRTAAPVASPTARSKYKLTKLNIHRSKSVTYLIRMLMNDAKEVSANYYIRRARNVC